MKGEHKKDMFRALFWKIHHAFMCKTDWRKEVPTGRKTNCEAIEIILYYIFLHTCTIILCIVHINTGFFH